MSQNPVKLINSLSRAFSSLKNATESFKSSSLASSFKKSGREINSFIKDIKRLNHAIEEEMIQTSKLGDTFKRTFSSKYLERSKAFFKQQLSWYPTKALTFAIMDIPKSTLRSYSQFQDALMQVRSVGQLTDSQMKSLGETMRDIGRTSKFSAIEIAEAAKSLAQAGFRGEELEAALRPANELATATNAKLNTATDVMSTIIRAYGLTANQYAEISDVLTNAVTNSKLSLVDLSTAFGYVASAASQTGVSFKETVTLLGVLANAGLKASTAATGLRMALLKITAPTRKAKKILANIGLSKHDLDIANRGIKEVLATISQLSTTDIIDIFGARSANAVLVFKNVSVEALDAIESLISQSGTASAIAQQQMLSLTKSWKNLSDKLTDTKIAIGNTFGEDLAVWIRAFGNALQDLVKNMGSVLQVSKTLFATWAGFKMLKFLNFKGLVKGFGSLKVAFSSLITGMRAGVTTGEIFKEIFVDLRLALVELWPLLAAVGAAAAAFFAIDTFRESYVDAERFKTSIVESQAAFSRMIGDAQNLVILMDRLSKSSISPGLKEFILSGAKDKFVEDVDTRYKKLSEVAGKYSMGVVSDLTAHQKALEKRIREAVSFKEIQQVIEDDRKWLSNYLKSDKVKETTEISLVNTEALDADKRVAKAKIREIIKDLSKERKKELTKSLSSLLNDPKILALSSQAADLFTLKSFTIKSPGSLEDVAELRKANQERQNLIEKLLVERDKEGLSEKIKKGLQEQIDQLNYANTITKLLIDQFTLSPENLQEIKRTSFKTASLILKHSFSGYKTLLTFGVGKSKATKQIKQGIKDQLYDALIKPFEDANVEIPPKVAKLYNELVKKLQRNFDKNKDLAENKKLNSKALTRVNSEIELLKSEIELRKKQDKAYDTLQKTLNLLLAKKLKLEQTKNRLDGVSSVVAENKAETKRNKDKLQGIKQDEQDAKAAAAAQKRQVEEQISYWQKIQDAYQTLRQYNIDYLGIKQEDEALNQKIIDAHTHIVNLQIEQIKLTVKDARARELLIKAKETEIKTFNANLVKASADLKKFKDDLHSSFADPITHVFDDVIEGTKSVKDAFKDMVENIIKSLAKIMVQRMMMNLGEGLADMLFGGAANGSFSPGYSATGYKGKNPWVQFFVNKAFQGTSSYFGGASGALGSSMGSGIANTSNLNTNYDFYNQQAVQQASESQGWGSTGGGAFDPGRYDLARTSTAPSVNIVNNGTASTVTDTYSADQVTTVVLDDYSRNGPISQQARG